jgi:hypothetical protein
VPVAFAVVALILRAQAVWAPMAALDGARAHEAAHKALEHGYQTELPGDRPSETLTGGERGEPSQAEEQGGGAGAGGMVASGMLWVVVAVLAALLLFWGVSELRGYNRDERAPAEPTLEPAGPEAAFVVERPLGDAETLARAGRFGEAIHVLLLRTLEALMRGLERPLPRSYTSREILARVHLPDDARAALTHLVTAVEVSHFGGAEPDATDYATCVERFQRFATVWRAGQAGAQVAGRLAS